MRCPRCGGEDSRVVDTRASAGGIRRRRECAACGHRFTTHERVELRLPLVVKKSGDREPFDGDKLRAGIVLACRKRPVPAADIEAAAARVEQRLLARCADEVPSAEIGREVLAELEALDRVAWLRFASVYFEVDSPRDFLDLLRPMLHGPEGAE